MATERKKQPPALRLTRSELELLSIEMQSALDGGAEDPAFATILRKVNAALHGTAGVDLPDGGGDA